MPDADDLDEPSGYLHRTEIDLAVPDLTETGDPAGTADQADAQGDHSAAPGAQAEAPDDETPGGGTPGGGTPGGGTPGGGTPGGGTPGGGTPGGGTPGTQPGPTGDQPDKDVGSPDGPNTPGL